MAAEVEVFAPMLDAFKGGDDSGDVGGSAGIVVDGVGMGTVGVVGLTVEVPSVVGKIVGTIVGGGGNEIVIGGRPVEGPVGMGIGTVGVMGIGMGFGFGLGFGLGFGMGRRGTERAGMLKSLRAILSKEKGKLEKVSRKWD